MNNASVMQLSSAGVENTRSLMSGDSEILSKLPRYQMMKHLKTTQFRHSERLLQTILSSERLKMVSSCYSMLQLLTAQAVVLKWRR